MFDGYGHCCWTTYDSNIVIPSLSFNIKRYINNIVMRDCWTIFDICSWIKIGNGKSLFIFFFIQRSFCLFNSKIKWMAFRPAVYAWMEELIDSYLPFSYHALDRNSILFINLWEGMKKGKFHSGNLLSLHFCNPLKESLRNCKFSSN